MIMPRTNLVVMPGTTPTDRPTINWGHNSQNRPRSGMCPLAEQIVRTATGIGRAVSTVGAGRVHHVGIILSRRIPCPRWEPRNV